MFPDKKIPIGGKNLIVILGNGFDLDLNLKTSYKNFMDSNVFKGFLNLSHKQSPYYPGCNLFDYLVESYEGHDKRWIDIEEELKDFSLHFLPFPKSIIDDAIESVEQSFNLLRQALTKY